jgi:putative toxin-antitoxin system antitoxin component (TIGR02293 family)
MTVKKKYSKKIKPSPQQFILEGPEAVYHLLPKNNLQVAYSKTDKNSPNESYIKRSIALMGMDTVKPFNEVENVIDFIDCIREGVPKKALDNLIAVTGIAALDMSGIIRTSDRTLRRYSSKQKLNAEQSERVIELARLYSRGEEVFGVLESFKEWMNSTVVALGNKKPKEFLDTSLGIEMLMGELGRIEHGIFA